MSTTMEDFKHNLELATPYLSAVAVSILNEAVTRGQGFVLVPDRFNLPKEHPFVSIPKQDFDWFIDQTASQASREFLNSFATATGAKLSSMLIVHPTEDAVPETAPAPETAAEVKQ